MPPSHRLVLCSLSSSSMCLSGMQSPFSLCCRYLGFFRAIGPITVAVLGIAITNIWHLECPTSDKNKVRACVCVCVCVTVCLIATAASLISAPAYLFCVACQVWLASMHPGSFSASIMSFAMLSTNTVFMLSSLQDASDQCEHSVCLMM